ncbi:MAG: hypothetical protein U0Q16_31880 [Bryobacteraceae bacterium]
MNIKLLRLLAAVAISHFTLLNGQPSTGTPSVDPFTRTDTIPAPFQPGESVSIWSWGTLVSVRDAKSEAPMLITLDRLNNTRSQTLSIPGARLVNIYSGRFAAGPDGSLAVAGSAYSDDSKATSFLALISRDGRQQKLVQLSPFAPRALTVASDGTIWMVGTELIGGKEVPDHDVLRRFDQSGRLIGSSVPRRSLVRKLGFTHPSENSYLAASKGRVGWYSEATGVYTEFALDGTVTGRFNTPSTIGMPGIAMCDDGQVFVSTDHKTANGERGWGIYVLARDRDTWSFAPGNGRWGMLFGCDGNRLVSTTDMTSLTWLEPNASALARFKP